MKVVVQRCKKASCIIDGVTVGKVNAGYMLLVGFRQGDSLENIQKMVKKIVNLRIFEDEFGKMNKNIFQTTPLGEILSISQFTLYANTNEGNRPSFVDAMNPNDAKVLYKVFNDNLRSAGIHVEEGVFGADMQIDFVNDGPVTIILEF